VADHRWQGRPVDPPGVLGGAAAVIAFALVATAHPAVLALPGAALAPVAVVATAIDLRHHRLPDRLTGGATVLLGPLVAAAALIESDVQIVVGAFAGAAVLAGFLLIVHLVSPAGMGFGDVKFGVPLGLAVGASAVAAVVVALAAGALLGAAAGALLLVRHRDRHRAFAFGPFLAAGAVLALVAT
jgi:leader peptidase (prepilin peptidase)/N-methyltransferase